MCNIKQTGNLPQNEMLNNPFTLKPRLKAGETLAGLFIAEFRSPSLGLILAGAGYDFGLVDMEHGAFSLSDMSAMIPNFRALKTQPVVRIPIVGKEFVQPLLDLGVAGLVVPMVENPEELHRCAELMKYPPEGRRGMSFCCPHSGFVPRDRDEYMESANENLLMIAMIETARGVENIDAILDVPGLDVVIVGNCDLAISMGEENDLTSGPVRDAMRHVLKSAQAKGVVGGGNFGDPELVADFLDLGLRFIVLSSEVDRLCTALRNVKHTFDRTVQNHKNLHKAELRVS